MLNKRNLNLLRYLCAPVSVALAIVLRLLLNPLMGDQFPLVTVFWAVVFTAWYGGFVPTLLAAALGYGAADYFVNATHDAINLADGEQFRALIRYAVAGIGTALLGEAMQRSRLRAERSAAEVRYQAALIDQVYDAVLVWDWQGALTFWNRGAEEMYGYARADALGRVSHDLLKTETTEGMHSVLHSLDSAGRWQGELSHLTRDGQRRWVESRMVRIREGERTYVIETNRDVTTRRALESLRGSMQTQLEQQVQQRTLELAKSEQRYRSLIQATAQIVWRADAQGMPLDSSLADYTGLSNEQIARGDYLHAASTADLEHPASAWQAALASGKAFHCECSIRRAADGLVDSPNHDRDMMVSVVPITNAAGDIEEWMGICVNISQRKQAERALSAREEQFRVLIEGIHGYAIVMLDPQGVIQTWSRSAERMVGYQAEEIVGQSFASLFTQQDIERGQPAFELKQARQLDKLEIDGWRVRRHGSQFWASGTLTALYDESECLIGFVQVMRDVTEKRRNDELLYSVLDNALDAIFSIDMEGTISLFNRAGEAMFGRSALEVVGRNMRLLLAEPSRKEYDAFLISGLQAANAKQFAVRHEVLGIRKSGEIFPIELAITGFELDQRRYFICILRDISERKNLEEQLRQSQKLEAFGQLAGGVAHDFNNILMVISGYSSLLMSSLNRHEEPYKFVSEIHRAGERAAGLTRQLLAFTRQQMLEPRVVDLNEIVRDIESMLLRVIGEDIRLQSVLASRLSQVKIDPSQVEQVIMNLVVNARDAMPQGGRLTIETVEVDVDEVYRKIHPQVRAGRFVVLTICDTGSGMTAAVKTRIFEPFFTTKRVGKGTGLGLAVVHGIVKQSGGSIEVHSELGLGTVFKIYLPAANELVIPNDAVDALEAMTGHETILLVEDDVGVRELVARSLQALGYKVLQAENGRAALKLLEVEQAKIDLLLTDVVMPEVSGRQVAEAFTRSNSDAKVLFVSGYTNDAVVRHGVLQSEAGFLQKPFTLNALASKVRESLSAV